MRNGPFFALRTSQEASCCTSRPRRRSRPINDRKLPYIVALAIITLLNTGMTFRSVSGFSRNRMLLSYPQWNHPRGKKKNTLLPSIARRKTSIHPTYMWMTSRITPDVPTSTEADRMNRSCCDCLFDLRLPEGRCVGLQLQELPSDSPDALTPEAITGNNNHWIRALLHSEEVEYGVNQPSQFSQESFFLGRLAMREALGLGPRHAQTTDPILKDQHGRPNVPRGFMGSISHKQRTGVALVAVDLLNSENSGDKPRHGIGIDIEQITSQRSSIAKKVLTENEINQLGQIEVRGSAE